MSWMCTLSSLSNWREKFDSWCHCQRSEFIAASRKHSTYLYECCRSGCHGYFVVTATGGGFGVLIGGSSVTVSSTFLFTFFLSHPFSLSLSLSLPFPPPYRPFTYDLHHECMSLLLVLLSSQMYGHSSGSGILLEHILSIPT